MIGVWALSGIIRRTASKIVPLAVRSTVYLSHQVTPSVKANNRTDLCGKPFYRLFSSSLDYSTELSSRVLFLRGVDSQEEEEEEVWEGQQVIPFSIEERPDRQTLVLTSVLTKEIGGEISKVEVQVPDADIGEHDDDKDNGDDEKAKQSSIPFVIRASYDVGACLEICCTSYLDKICFNHMSVVEDPSVSYSQIDLYMIENLLKTYLMHGIKLSTIHYLRVLKLELNEFKKSFTKLSQELSIWSFVSSVLDYAHRRRFDIKILFPWDKVPSDPSDDDRMEMQHVGIIGGYKHRSELIYVLTREYKDETICVELLKPSISELGEVRKESVIPFIFSLSNVKGMCLEFHCAAYPGKISLDVLHVINGWRSVDLTAGGALEIDLETYKKLCF